MAYVSDIPKSGQTLGGTRQQINDNFTLLGNTVGPSLNAIALTMSEETLPTTAANQGALYTAVDPSTPNETNLFFGSESAGNSYQLTKSYESKYPTLGTSTGWSFLPGNTTSGALIVQWGFIAAGATSGSVTFGIAYTSALFNLQLTAQENIVATVRVHIDTSSTTGFTWVSVRNTTDIFWMAIGV